MAATFLLSRSGIPSPSLVLAYSPFERGHKVLVSSQFVTMLNVIEVSVPTLSAHHLLMDDGDDRVGRSSSNADHCAA